MQLLQAVLSRGWVIFILTVLIHGATTQGVARVGSDTAHYVALADELRQVRLGATFNLDAVRWTKTFFLLVLAAARWASDTRWPLLIVALNVASSGALAVLLVDVLRRMRLTTPTLLLGWGLYLACWEIWQWLPFVLTDSLFTFSAFLPFWVVSREILGPGRRNPWQLVAVSGITAFTRPPGLLVVAVSLAAREVFVTRRLGVRRVLIVGLLATSLLVAVRTLVVHDPSRWPSRLLRPKLIEFSAREKQGEVVYDRLETFRPDPRTARDHLVIVTDRFVRFFQITARDFSLRHKQFNVLYFIPLYLLAMAGLASGRYRSPRERAVTALGGVLVVSFAALHAVTVLDYDWRFRGPVMPFLIVLASCGLDLVVSRVLRPAHDSVPRDPRVGSGDGG